MISVIYFAYGKVMKVAAMFYLHDVIYDLTICSLKDESKSLIPALLFVEVND